MAHAWEAFCWIVFGIGIFGMTMARTWLSSATSALRNADRIHAQAISERQETMRAVEGLVGKLH